MFTRKVGRVCAPALMVLLGVAPLALGQPVLLQGGDTCADAPLIPYPPVTLTGTTVGYNNDYDEACPYAGSTAPDVVYRFEPAGGSLLAYEFDLCQSSYDTKLYIYEEDCPGTLVACNDDHCSDSQGNPYRSWLFVDSLVPGRTYYVVIDGYGTDAGDYELQVHEYFVDPFLCDPDAELDGEGACSDEYIDTFNSGCSGEGYPFSPEVECGDKICGSSGTYRVDLTNYRDTDWFPFIPTEDALLTVRGAAGFNLRMFVIEDLSGTVGGGCASGDVEILVTDTSLPLETLVLTTPVAAGHVYYIWAGPDDFTGVQCGNPYQFELDCTELPLGACCLPNGDCVEVTQIACATMGDYQGDDSLCADVDCPFVPCPEGALLEGEPVCSDEYVDTYNPLCWNGNPAYLTIESGETYCGESGTFLRDGDEWRDADFYVVEVADVPLEYAWELTATFDSLLSVSYLPNGPCGPQDFTVSSAADAFETHEVRLCLDQPGQYAVGVTTLMFNGVPCGSDYVLSMSSGPCPEPCVLPCVEGAVPEGEPDCGPEYVDTYNGGCGSPSLAIAPVVEAGETICGRTGTFLRESSAFRDTDWWGVQVPWFGGGVLSIRLTACDVEMQGMIIDPGSQDCVDYEILTAGVALPGQPLELSADVGQGPYWLWFAPVEFSGVPCGTEYQVETLYGNCPWQLVGDANCDGHVDNFDIDAFVWALTQGYTGWNALYGDLGCEFECVLDINGDGFLNGFDIDPFIALLTD